MKECQEHGVQYQEQGRPCHACENEAEAKSKHESTHGWRNPGWEEREKESKT